MGELDLVFSLAVLKSKRELRLYRQMQSGPDLIKAFRVALGSQPSGPKLREGDGATPEGHYFITHRNHASRYYLSLGLSYPNVHDATRGLGTGLISQWEFEAIVSALEKYQKPLQKTALGGDIFIHGGGVSGDWTQGCIALENSDMKELFDLLPLRTPVTILA